MNADEIVKLGFGIVLLLGLAGFVGVVIYFLYKMVRDI